MTIRVDLLCSVLNGERYLPALLDSLDAQTHRNWALRVRDDGSTDDTVRLVRARAAADPRVELADAGGPRLGVGGSFGWLLERRPADARYLMVVDADDVWLPDKIDRTLAAMRRAEAAEGASTPTLVHTDLVVVDESLRVVSPSFWAFAGFDPEPATLRRVMVQNVATAPTLMLNRALADLIGSTPPVARFQDAWYALVAAAFGRIVAVREATVLYRQHPANCVGARDGSQALRRVPRRILELLRGRNVFRDDLAHSAAMAGALLERHAERLAPEDRQMLHEFARLPAQPFFRRKAALLRYRILPGARPLAIAGMLLRG